MGNLKAKTNRYPNKTKLKVALGYQANRMSQKALKDGGFIYLLALAS